MGHTKSGAKRQYTIGGETGEKNGACGGRPGLKESEFENYAALAYLAAVGRVTGFLLDLREGLLGGLRFLLCGKFSLDFLGYRVGIHLAVLGDVFERFAGLRLRPGCAENDCLD
jgi:hypothetical protein